MNKRKKISIVVSIFSFVVIAFSTFGIHNCVASHKNAVYEESKSRQEMNDAKRNYEKHKDKVETQAMNQAISSGDPVLKQTAIQKLNYKKVSKIAKQFFSVYYTWTDSASYLKRAGKVNNIITPGLKANKEVFDDGKDSTGGDYIKATGVQSKFQDCEAYMTNSKSGKAEALVKVTNESWYKGNSNNSGTATHYYDLTLDLNTNKISNLKLVVNKKAGATGGE